jgi:hypothetical protein
VARRPRAWFGSGILTAPEASGGWLPETASNVEIAHRIHEHAHAGSGTHSRRAEWVEILEAVVLAAVAVLMAWSGYQAARCDARSAANYSLAASTTVQAQERQTLAGQDRHDDITTFDSWIEARSYRDEKLAAIFERRFRPEYAAAFLSRMKTDRFHTPGAPSGPIFMPEYRSTRAETARQPNEKAPAASTSRPPWPIESPATEQVLRDRQHQLRPDANLRIRRPDLREFSNAARIREAERTRPESRLCS